jgi:hypothetical protein
VVRWEIATIGRPVELAASTSPSGGWTRRTGRSLVTG